MKDNIKLVIDNLEDIFILNNEINNEDLKINYKNNLFYSICFFIFLIFFLVSPIIYQTIIQTFSNILFYFTVFSAIPAFSLSIFYFLSNDRKKIRNYIKKNKLNSFYSNRALSKKNKVIELEEKLEKNGVMNLHDIIYNSTYFENKNDFSSFLILSLYTKEKKDFNRIPYFINLFTENKIYLSNDILKQKIIKTAFVEDLIFKTLNQIKTEEDIEYLNKNKDIILNLIINECNESFKVEIIKTLKYYIKNDKKMETKQNLALKKMKSNKNKQLVIKNI